MKSTIQLTALLLVITCAAIFLSCDDDDDDNDETPKTKRELLTAGPWKRTALTSNPAYDWNANGVSDTDVLSIMFPCEKDNFEEYKANGIVETNEGPTKCNSADPQIWTETWDLIDNEIFYADYGYKFTLVEVTETTLKLTVTFEENGITYTHDEAYSH